MPLGWIDFSKSERNKVLSVLDLLSEAGTLDELGIAASQTQTECCGRLIRWSENAERFLLLAKIGKA